MHDYEKTEAAKCKLSDHAFMLSDSLLVLLCRRATTRAPIMKLKSDVTLTELCDEPEIRVFRVKFAGILSSSPLRHMLFY